MDSCEISSHINEFIGSEDKRILILGSMQTKIRDKWVQKIQEVRPSSFRCFSLSNRFKNNIEEHRNIKSDSIYASIYNLNRSELDSGTQSQRQSLSSDNATNNSRESEEVEQDEIIQRIVPVKNISADIESQTLIILDAHLVSRSLVQSEFLRFGSGRLLEDLFKSTEYGKDAKYVFIGDPYSMSVGKTTDNALDRETVQTLSQISAELCAKYNESLDTITCTNARDKLRLSLARSIEQKTFNIIPYTYDTDTLSLITQEGIQSLMSEWFTGNNNPREFDNKILLYRNSDCLSTNLYIKRYYKKNGESLANGDLLLLDLDNSPYLVCDNPIDKTNTLSSGSYIRIKYGGRNEALYYV